jgi:hypothetical protein
MKSDLIGEEIKLEGNGFSEQTCITTTQQLSEGNGLSEQTYTAATQQSSEGNGFSEQTCITTTQQLSEGNGFSDQTTNTHQVLEPMIVRSPDSNYSSSSDESSLSDHLKCISPEHFYPETYQKNSTFEVEFPKHGIIIKIDCYVSPRWRLFHDSFMKSSPRYSVEGKVEGFFDHPKFVEAHHQDTNRPLWQNTSSLFDVRNEFFRTELSIIRVFEKKDLEFKFESYKTKTPSLNAFNDKAWLTHDCDAEF